MNGTTLSGPTTVTSWKAYTLNVSAGAQVDGAGRSWTFAGWSDGGAASHAITTPSVGRDLHRDVTSSGAVPRRLRAGNLSRWSNSPHLTVQQQEVYVGLYAARATARARPPTRTHNSPRPSRAVRALPIRSSARPPTTSPSASSAPQAGARSWRSPLGHAAGSASATRLDRKPARRRSRRPPRGTPCRCMRASEARASPRCGSTASGSRTSADRKGSDRHRSAGCSSGTIRPGGPTTWRSTTS